MNDGIPVKGYASCLSAESWTLLLALVLRHARVTCPRFALWVWELAQEMERRDELDEPAMPSLPLADWTPAEIGAAALASSRVLQGLRAEPVARRFAWRVHEVLAVTSSVYLNLLAGPAEPLHRGDDDG